ncbi:MAG: Cytochrome oxidase, cbb3-type, subunit [Dehalococcoidia bacterium]|nr:Cytochrome oxidase, cbb3-type, subunit [Dehalococcoidia bacterium]
MNENTTDIRALKRAHLQGKAVLALGVVLGLAFSLWLSGGLGPPRSLLSANSLALGNHSENTMPRLRHGLVLTEETRGRVLFGRYCDSCHPGGEEGRGESLVSEEFQRDFQNEFQITQLVRDGTCIMPAYNRFFLADGDLAEIAKFALGRSQAAAQVRATAPLPPLDGPGIMQQKCANCHDTVDPPLDTRDPQVLYVMELEMARCAGLTAVQKETLRTHLLSQQVR